MSAADTVVRTPPPVRERILCGWGRTGSGRCSVIAPRDAEDVLRALTAPTAPTTGVIARGAGRSYGDAAQNTDGVVLDTTGLDRIVEIDRERRLVIAQAGVTVAQLLSVLASHGLTLPVVPGTRHVTVAGAIASDIHGKSHHRDGAFARHVVSISLCTPARGLLDVSAEDEPELFYATLGGMGLTGVVVQATLRAEPLSSPWLVADADRTDSLAHTLDAMSGPERHRYSVAWLDLMADGPRFARAIVSRADPFPADRLWVETPSSVSRTQGEAGLGRPVLAAQGPARRRRGERDRYPRALAKEPFLNVPAGFSSGLLRPAAVRAFNALRWHRAPRRERGRKLAVVPYLFPLDAVGAWNHLYGQAGLIQYQLVIPTGQEPALERCFELIAARRLPVYLAVLKRFGAASGGPMSFPLAGWTLALDLPAAADRLRATLDELDQIVAACGGRVYLSKDCRLGRDALVAMYPRLDLFQEQRALVDPDGVLRSDLAVRLGLCGPTR